MDFLGEITVLDHHKCVLRVWSAEEDTTGQVDSGIWGSGEQALVEDVAADRRERSSAVCGNRGRRPFCTDRASLEIGLGVAPY